MVSFLKVCYSFWHSDWVIFIILSSKSLTRSVIPSLLFIPSSVFFISVIVYNSVLTGSFSVFSNSSSKFSLCSSLLFPNSVSILTTNALNSLSNKLFISVSFVVFQGFSLVFQLRYIHLFSFCLWSFLCLSEIAETVTYCGPEGVSLCGSIPILPVCAQWLCWESWIWCEHKSCLSSGCVGSYHLGWRWVWRRRG